MSTKIMSKKYPASKQDIFGLDYENERFATAIDER